MARTNQGGSVLSFVMIGIILAGLLIGGIYLVKRQFVTQPQPQSPPAAQKPQEPAKQQSPPPAQAQNSQPAPSSGPPTNTTQQLPATGSSETIGAVLILGLLSAVAASYMQSRRPRLSLV